MTFIPCAEFDLVASHGQLGQGTGQVGDAGALPGGGIQRQCQVRAVPQDRLHQAGEPVAGANLDETGDPCCVHRLYLGHELDRLGELVCQLGLGCLRVGGVDGGGAVGVHRDPGRLQVDFFQRRQEGGCRVGDQRTVEGGGDGELLAGDAARTEQLLGALDLAGAAGQYGLGRGVLVGDYQVNLLLGQHLAYLGERRRNGEHAPLVTFPFAHQAAAQPRQGVQSILVDASGGAQRAKLAVAVAGDGLGQDAKALQKAQRSDAGGADGGLGGLGGAQLALLRGTGLGIEGGNGVDEVGKKLAVLRNEPLVGRRHALQQLREAAGQVVQHAGVLGALAGEEHAELPGVGSAGEIGAVGGLPGRFGVLLQHRLGVFQQGREVGLAPLQDQRKSAGGLGVEAGARSMREVPECLPGELRADSLQGRGQGRGIAPREGKELGIAVPVRALFVRGVLLQDHVEVGAAETEGADSGAPGGAVPGEPGTLLGRQVERSPAGGHFLLGVLHLYGGRNDLVVQRQRGLDDAGCACGGLGVADL